MSFEQFKQEIEMGSRECRKKGTIIKSKEREVIKTIIELCDQEAKQKCLYFPLRQATKRAAQYAKVSERTIKRIREQVKWGVEFNDDDCPSGLSKIKRSKMGLKFACNLSFMFPECASLIGRYQLAKKVGFKYVESGFPLGFSVEQVVEAKTKADVQQVLINVFTGDVTKGDLGFAAVPGEEYNFQNSIELTIEYAKALDCRKIHVMSGKVDVLTKGNDEAYENNLRYAVKRFEEENIIGLIEPINSHTVPNYYMNSFDKGLSFIKKIDSPNLRLMLDIFHLQQICGNLTYSIREYLPYVGHVQIAQVPDRNEPDTPGEIDYKYIFSLLEQEGYEDYVGLEYKPKSSTFEGIKWIRRFGFSF